MNALLTIEGLTVEVRSRRDTATGVFAQRTDAES